MGNRYVLALDAGTSGIRCLISDLHGQVVAVSRRDYNYHTPPEVAPLGKEFNTEELWQKVCDCIGKTIHIAGIEPKDLVGVSATSQREDLFFLDKNGVELYGRPNID
jgi:sugar (pentulose or hexulose) kinase